MERKTMSGRLTFFSFCTSCPSLSLLMVKYQMIPPPSSTALLICRWISLIIVQVICGLRNKPEHVFYIHRFSCFVFGTLGYLMMGLIAYIGVMSTTIDLWLKLTTAIAFVAPLIAGLFHLELLSISLSFLQYRFMLPTFVNVISIYSICNTHDVSWYVCTLHCIESFLP